MKANEIINIPKEKFKLADTSRRMGDKKLETRPIGYFRDAWNRFCKNKASVIGAVIIMFIVLYAVIVPIISPYPLDFAVTAYSKKLPKNDFLAQFGICTGQTERELNNTGLTYRVAIGMGAADVDGTGVTWEEGLANEYCPIKKVGDTYIKNEKEYRKANVDVYLEEGFRFFQVTDEQYENIRAWQEENGIQVIYPMIDIDNEQAYVIGSNDANVWYKVNPNSPKKEPDAIITKGFSFINFDMNNPEHKLEPNYLTDDDGNVRYYKNVGKAEKKIRVLYYNYYQYLCDTEYAAMYGITNVTTPQYIFGTDASGYDIAVRLAYGIRLSLIIAVCVSLINFFIGTIYGAIEGYFGGWADILMERVSDVLSGVPFIVVATLFQLHLSNQVGPVVSLLFAFVLTGWIGTAYRVRTQFYRFKNSEYVFAARTLGASDARLMFKHILPNSLGTIITSSVLVITGVIFSESMLSYLGIMSTSGDAGASLGSMLASAQGSFMQYPHMIFFPAIVISLLMISFNLFGNGLRDAFNPSLRGVEE